jgi:hypothetical protein
MGPIWKAEGKVLGMVGRRMMGKRAQKPADAERRGEALGGLVTVTANYRVREGLIGTRGFLTRLPGDQESLREAQAKLDAARGQAKAAKAASKVARKERRKRNKA